MEQQEKNKNFFVHESSYIDDNVFIGSRTKIWHFSHIMSESIIGENVVIGQNVLVGPKVKVGDNCKIQNNVSLYEGVVLENNVFCGPSCVFTNVFNPRSHIERKKEFLTTLIQEGVTIGANATIICGITIQKYAFIGAGSVVTRNIKNNALVYGVPAKFQGWISDYGEILTDKLVCPKTHQKYKEINLDGEIYLIKS